MATKMIGYPVHGVAESSNIKATECGHAVNLLVDEDNGIDNGSFVTFDITSGVAGSAAVALGVDVLGKAAKPAKNDPVYLVLSVPAIYQNYTPKMQEESNFFNGKGEIARCYELIMGDRFALSKECFTVPSDAAVGKYISMSGSSYKATVGNSAAQDTAFVGYIYAQAANGHFYVVVLRNEALGVSYTLSLTNNVLTLTGSDGSESSVTFTNADTTGY